MKLTMILLAAGNSRRFGSNKLFYEVEGQTLFAHALELFLKVRDKLEFSLLVVTQYPEIEKLCAEHRIPVFINPHPEQGISSSMKIGLSHALDADACLFSVCDQPWLCADTVVRLIRDFLLSKKGMAAVSKEGIPGNPCIFSRKYYPELLSLIGDKGGKRILNAHPGDVILTEAGDLRELEDLDTIV